MLFLSRYPGESIQLGSNIKIFVQSVKAQAVELTIDTGSSIPISINCHLHERLRLGANVSIRIERVRGNKVRLGIDAPSCIPVLRKELVVAAMKQAVLPELVPAIRSKNVLVGA